MNNTECSTTEKEDVWKWEGKLIFWKKKGGLRKIQNNNIAVLDWLYDHTGEYALELLTYEDHNRYTVFDHANKLSDNHPLKISIIEWLHRHIRN